MKSMIDNWVALRQVWDESLGGNLEPEIKGRIIGVKSQMYTFNYFYRVTMMVMMMMMMNCPVVWLTDKRRLALFPHHHESPPRREQDLNLSRT